MQVILVTLYLQRSSMSGPTLQSAQLLTSELLGTGGREGQFTMYALPMPRSLLSVNLRFNSETHEGSAVLTKTLIPNLYMEIF